MRLVWRIRPIILLTLIVLGAFAFLFHISPVEANGTIYIRADGEVDPSTALISTVDYVTYTLTGNIIDSIVIERDDITIDGAAHFLQGAGIGIGLSLSGRTNVVVKNLNVSNFEIGLSLQNSSDNQISYNTLTKNVRGIVLASYSSRNYIHDNNVVTNNFGIELDYSNSNVIYWNNLTTNRLYGMYVENSSSNFICQNNFMNNMNQVYTYKSVNDWFDWFPTYGNYWSDYTGIDVKKGYWQNVVGSDGIGDTRYVVHGDEIDMWPLMKPFWLMKEPSKSLSPGYYETSEYLIGSVAIGVIFVESNGTVDTDTENWTETQEKTVITQLEKDSNWWVSLNPSARLSFQMEVHYRVPTSYEPISRAMGDCGLWMTETIEYLGCRSVLDYANDLRNRLHTNWVFIMFIVNNFNDADHLFADGLGSHEPIGGPYIIDTFTHYQGPPQELASAAHGTGHNFYGTDEYNNRIDHSGYLNVSDKNNPDCIMGCIFFPDLSGYVPPCDSAQGQFGWRDSDNDGIPDIIDTFPEITLNPNQSGAKNLMYGYVTEVPYPNHNPYEYAWPRSHILSHEQTVFPIPRSGRSITINTISNVEYRIDDGPWINATAVDGAFDEAQENFTFTIPSFADSHHVIEVCTTNSVGNNASAFAKPFCGAHDVGVASLYLSKTIVGQGHGVNVTARILNYGVGKESFNVTFCANSTTIQTQIVELTAQNLTALTIVWNSTGVPCGNYTLTAYAEPVQGETDTSDNNCTCWVIVSSVADLTGQSGYPDGRVDMKDVSYVARRFMCLPSDPLWDSIADVNSDGKVDMKDISNVARHFGEHYP
jgi:parallel beta-helix repeat protein